MRGGSKCGYMRGGSKCGYTRGGSKYGYMRGGSKCGYMRGGSKCGYMMLSLCSADIDDICIVETISKFEFIANYPNP